MYDTLHCLRLRPDTATPRHTHTVDSTVTHFKLQIIAVGHSRVLVHCDGHPTHIVGLLLVKKLIALDPEDARPIHQFKPLRKPVVVSPTTDLFKLLNTFQEGHSHLALVTPDVEGMRRLIRSDDWVR